MVEISDCLVSILSAYVRGSIHNGYDEEGIGYNADLSLSFHNREAPDRLL
jgi:hypothetical protein